MAKLKKDEFVFRKQEGIGSAAAESDSEYLQTCFVDGGDLEVLRDCKKSQRIVVGRTGAGKTALLIQLRAVEEHAVVVEPEDLSLQYLSNSTLLRGAEALDVKLEVFYKLLWKHIFAVELIKAKFHLQTEDDKRGFWQSTLALFGGNKKKEEAMKYLQEWGESFWKETDYRVREVTQKFEADVRAKLGAKIGALEAGIGGSKMLSVEEKVEVANLVQEVVDRIQIRELTNVLRLLAEEFFRQEQPRYYLIIDRLDEDWIDDRLRYRLIKALIETVRDFQKAGSVKVILALRRDLLDRVIRATRSPGFQEEKYEGLLLRLHWPDEQLLELLNKRVQALVRRQYTTAPVSWRDLLPTHVDGMAVDQYILERTLRRPRDIIMFFNACMDSAVGFPSVTVAQLKVAEATYSKQRLRALADEWRADYPDLIPVSTTLLARKTPAFALGDLREATVGSLLLPLLELETDQKGPLYELILSYFDDRRSLEDLVTELFYVFYRVGLIGLRTGTGERIRWSFLDSDSLAAAEVRMDARVQICPAFHSVLGVASRR